MNVMDMSFSAGSPFLPEQEQTSLKAAVLARLDGRENFSFTLCGEEGNEDSNKAAFLAALNWVQIQFMVVPDYQNFGSGKCGQLSVPVDDDYTVVVKKIGGK